tara:strand:- start:268 stop:1089 length:822 start_codon:yes stop_codon:yes gene_type:complete
MADYKENAGAILNPGNQINRLSSYNTEGVYAWPGVEAFELIGYAKVSNKAADKASYKSFSLTIPSPDRRPGDRVRSDRTSLVVQASADRPAYIYGASISIGQDIPAGGLATYPASPVTADIQGTNTEILLLGPDNGGAPLGVPSPQANGLAAASSSLTFGATTIIKQGVGDTTTGDLPFWTVVTTGGITAANAANSMFYKVTADTTFKVYNTNGITQTAVNGDGVYISDTDADAKRSAYILARVNYLRPASAVNWNNIQEYIDFASQIGGNDE